MILPVNTDLKNAIGKKRSLGVLSDSVSATADGITGPKPHWSNNRFFFVFGGVARPEKKINKKYPWESAKVDWFKENFRTSGSMKLNKLVKFAACRDKRFPPRMRGKQGLTSDQKQGSKAFSISPRVRGKLMRQSAPSAWSPVKPKRSKTPHAGRRFFAPTRQTRGCRLWAHRGWFVGVDPGENKRGLPYQKTFPLGGKRGNPANGAARLRGSLYMGPYGDNKLTRFLQGVNLSVNVNVFNCCV